MDELPSPSPPSLQELTMHRIIPHMVSFAVSNAMSSEVILILNLRTGLTTLIQDEAEVSVDVYHVYTTKDAPLPASRSSIETMPVVDVVENGSNCTVCFDEFVAGDKVKEMPCKHKYHADCIEEWLRRSGSCPICRYNMPVEEYDFFLPVKGDYWIQMLANEMCMVLDMTMNRIRIPVARHSQTSTDGGAQDESGYLNSVSVDIDIGLILSSE